MKNNIMQFFAFNHLPAHLQQISYPFSNLAITINDTLPENEEKRTALRKLLEAKDCAVRSVVQKYGE